MVVVINLSLAVLMLLLPLYFKYRPAKDMNDTKGFRTERSQQSQAAWDFAQKYWPKVLLRLSIGVILIQLILLSLMDRDVTILVTVFLWVMALLTSVFLTEEKLRDVFDKQGR